MELIIDKLDLIIAFVILIILYGILSKAAQKNDMPSFKGKGIFKDSLLLLRQNRWILLLPIAILLLNNLITILTDFRYWDMYESIYTIEKIPRDKLLQTAVSSIAASSGQFFFAYTYVLSSFRYIGFILLIFCIITIIRKKKHSTLRKICVGLLIIFIIYIITAILMSIFRTSLNYTFYTAVFVIIDLINKILNYSFISIFLIFISIYVKQKQNGTGKFNFIQLARKIRSGFLPLFISVVFINVIINPGLFIRSLWQFLYRMGIYPYFNYWDQLAALESSYTYNLIRFLLTVFAMVTFILFSAGSININQALKKTVLIFKQNISFLVPYLAAIYFINTLPVALRSYYNILIGMPPFPYQIMVIALDLIAAFVNSILVAAFIKTVLRLNSRTEAEIIKS